jgi:hypothetical protein
MNLLLDGVPVTDPHPTVVRVPNEVACCPECGGQLYLQVEACGTESRIPDEHGIEVDCENEPDPEDENFDTLDQHRWWQGEWQPVIDKVYRWATKHIRVQETP